jgi:hypothetical protein
MLGYLKIPEVIIAQTHISIWLSCRFSLFDGRSLAKWLSIQVLHRPCRLTERSLKPLRTYMATTSHQSHSHRFHTV